VRRLLAKRLLAAATLAGSLAVALTGCAVGPLSTGGPRPAAASAPAGSQDADRTGAGAAVPAESAPASMATRTLLEQSQAELEAGDLGGAAATVERALTIAPDEALLWIALAEIRLAQGDGVLAQEMARKALTLTTPDSEIAARARRLIAR
jgi:Flp pilus assembly protein TadD